MVLKFRMLSDENDNFVRDYEILSDMTLLDLHNFICRTLEFDANNITSFFSSNEYWDKLREFTLIDMGSDPFNDDDDLNDGEESVPKLLMSDVTIDKVADTIKDRLIYYFDMLGDRALYLELIEIFETSTHRAYPQLVKIEEDAPNQFDANDSSKGSESVFDEIMSEFNDFEGDDEYDDDGSQW